MQFKDYYATLGVAPDAGEADIKSAYRRLARKYHPDVSKEAGAEERFKGINEAYEALRDPQRRAAYDQLRAGGYRPGQEYHPPGGGSGFDFRFEEDGGSGFSDFFESLFGRARAGARPGTGARRDDEARIEVDLETVAAGGTQRVRVGERTLDVRIPKGIQPGQQIRLSGQGRQGGDLRLEIAYRPHPQFRVDGRDIVYVLPVAPWEAVLGAELSVPTLGGSVQLKVPAGSDGGRRLRLRGRGLPSGAAGDAAGDQLVELQVRLPPANSEQDRAFWREMAERFRFDPRGTR